LKRLPAELDRTEFIMLAQALVVSVARKRRGRDGGAGCRWAAIVAILALLAMPLDAFAQPEKTAPPDALKPATPPVTVLSKHNIQAILGQEVRSSSGEDMGRIVNVIVDRAGDVRAAIIDFGGFLGLGNRKVAVDWNALHFDPGSKSGQITLALTKDQVKAAPEYKEGKPVVVLGASGGTQTVPADEFQTRPEQ
jgi:hypothetical protein